MPYISQAGRRVFEAGLKLLARPNSPGELNFLFSALVGLYIESRGLSYQTINDILGAFDGASKEFYRRVAVPYEDKKIAANGDVYFL
jgi:hypothetical protein